LPPASFALVAFSAFYVPGIFCPANSFPLGPNMRGLSRIYIENPPLCPGMKVAMILIMQSVMTSKEVTQ
jgi:hypothetical protein